MEDTRRFENLTFEDFRRMAGDPSLSRYEKIGFPNDYREGKEAAIWADIRSKLPLLQASGKTVLDIGPGCSELPSMLIDLCRERGHRLILLDSAEMLAQLPDEPFIEKHACLFPDGAEAIAELRGRVDVLLCYSVLHYIFADGNLFDFLDEAMALMAHGGEMLLGDIPNLSKRRRFFRSPAGIAHHRAFTGDPDAMPDLGEEGVAKGVIDDSVVLAILARARAAGFDAHALLQHPDLPMANRREDIMLRRP